MPAHEKAYVRIRGCLQKICKERTRYVPGTHEYTVLTTAMDKYLDEWYDITHRATEWDAHRWGFYSDTWMVKERRQMENSKRMYKGIDGRWYEIQQQRR